MATFRYFQAPEKAMLELETGPFDPSVQEFESANYPCSFCGKDGRCLMLRADADGNLDDFKFFLADTTDSKTLTVFRGSAAVENNGQPTYYFRGCFDCLREGRFTVWHDTEAGEIRNGQLISDEPVSDFPQEAVVELSRTPSFWTWQQASWLICCNNFMLYMGEWGEEDFNRYAPNGAGKDLFDQVQQCGTQTWDQLREDGFYVFRCSHCEKWRAFDDQD